MSIDLKKGLKIGGIAVLVFVVGGAIVMAIVASFSVNSTRMASSGYGASTAGLGMADIGMEYSENLALGSAGPSNVIDAIRSKSASQDLSESPAPATAPAAGTLTMKKIVKNGSLTIYVKDADQAAIEIQNLTVGMGGFVSESNIYKSTDGIKRGRITIRVPADRFEEALKGTKAIAAEVDHETVRAEDVTEQFQDYEIQIRNLEAEEGRYLELMGRTGTMNDTLQVANRLSDVRGQIERMKGQLQFLSRQVDMSTIAIDLSADADIEVFGLRWRPLVVAKQALKKMFSGLTGYADAMIGLIFALPVVILWLATILAIIWVSYRVIRWFYQKTFKKGPEIKLS